LWIGEIGSGTPIRTNLRKAEHDKASSGLRR
jgi:hypothetical protein